MQKFIIFSKFIRTAIIFSFLCILPFSSFTQIVIDSVKTTPSTCPNNGSISVHATSSLPLFYSIVSGPVTQDVQTNHVFNSLPPGNYTIRISDGISHHITRPASITGNYQTLDFTPITHNPYCSGSNDGKIIGNRALPTGKGPFTWQLIAPSTVTSAPQVSDTFLNLPAGNYTVRVTDACGSYRTIVATLKDPSNTNLKILHTPQVEILQGNSGMVTFFMQTELFRFPFTYKFETNHGTYTTTTPTLEEVTYYNTTTGGGSLTVQHLIPNFTYGNYLKVTVTDDCGKSVATDLNFANNFYFCPSNNSKFNNCTYETTASFYINCAPYNNKLSTGICKPVKYQFIDISTNQVADSGTLKGDPNHVWHNAISSVRMKPVTGNKTYKVIINDGCGNTFSSNYTINNPVPPAPKITRKSISKAVCIDSVAAASIDTDLFRSAPRLIMLSGPSRLGSTKPEYAYQNSYAYPDTLTYTSWGGGINARYNFDIVNLSPGTYRFKIIDSCGSEILDSLIIKETHVSDLKHRFWYKKGCLGKNQIHYTANSPGYINVRTQNGSISQYKYHNSSYNINDSILNLPSGKYIVTFTYSQVYARQLNEFPIACTRITDTITIEGYETPEIFTANSIKCKGATNMVLLPDSSKGVPPYQYEIISGPETFPVQYANSFIINTPGIYTARIYDVCGNASTKQISIDTLAFTPLSMVRTCNKVRILYPASSYHFYKWTRPDQSTFISDSLFLDPITPADTGVYTITKITDINGCKDTLRSSFHVTLKNINVLNRTICKNEYVMVGGHIYGQTGIYMDTLVSSNGCDSIVQLNLIANQYKYHVVNKTICQGEHILFGGKIYWQEGIYRDTLATATCDSIVILNLSFHSSPYVSLGNDTSLCQGQSLILDAGSGNIAYYWNEDLSDTTRQTLTVDQEGEYRVTVKNQYGCTASDTMQILKVHPKPSIDAGQDKSICPGELIWLSASGGHTYKWLPGGNTQSGINVSPDTTTSFMVIAYDEYGCSSLPDMVTVHVKPAPEKPVFDNNYIQYCFDEGALTLKANYGKSFLWADSGDTTQHITVSRNGTYEVKVVDYNGCPISAKVTINENCAPRIFVPEAFSPDNNGSNDKLEIFGKYFKNFEMKIFNRWGEIIFITKDRNIQWDGTYRGENMPVGSYPWVIHYENEHDSDVKIMRGSVTLIR